MKKTLIKNHLENLATMYYRNFDTLKENDFYYFIDRDRARRKYIAFRMGMLTQPEHPRLVQDRVEKYNNEQYKKYFK